MTIREAAEMLYDEYTGTTGLLGNSTQEARWVAFTEKVVAASGVKAEAWDEGHLDGCDDQPWCTGYGDHLRENPYRKGTK